MDGKVVQILNPFEIVVNLGSEQGVTEKTKFVVYAVGDEIRDPDTGESLGLLEIVRGRARVKHRQPKMATLRSERTRFVTRETTPMATTWILGGSQKIIEREDEDLPFEAVEVGDRVRSL
jgi:hypothetical protein